MDTKEILNSTVSLPALEAGRLLTYRSDPFAPRIPRASKKTGGWKYYTYVRPYKGSRAAKRASRGY